MFKYHLFRLRILPSLHSRGVTVHVFVPNRPGTGTSVRLQRCTAVRKCGVDRVTKQIMQYVQCQGKVGIPDAECKGLFCEPEFKT
jgi:hypothetical protein